jgi:hypothetical protein
MDCRYIETQDVSLFAPILVSNETLSYSRHVFFIQLLKHAQCIRYAARSYLEAETVKDFCDFDCFSWELFQYFYHLSLFTQAQHFLSKVTASPKNK